MLPLPLPAGEGCGALHHRGCRKAGDTLGFLNTPAAFTLRPITAADDVAMAEVIRSVMPEFGACGPGFALTDPEVDHLCAAYSVPRAAYFVLEHDGSIVGGGGIAPLEGATRDVCELRKMYFLKQARGLGQGQSMLRQCLEAARGFGFTRCYLETLTGMDAAQHLYKQAGFKSLCGPLGATGHFGCDRYYALDL